MKASLVSLHLGVGGSPPIGHDLWSKLLYEHRAHLPIFSLMLERRTLNLEDLEEPPDFATVLLLRS